MKGITRITESIKMRLTPKQERMIGWLAKDIMLSDGLGKRYFREHEYKVFELVQFEGDSIVYLTTEVGMKNDEGKASSIFCRTRRIIQIGRRGGCKLLNGKGKSKLDSVKRRGYWQAVHALTH